MFGRLFSLRTASPPSGLDEQVRMVDVATVRTWLAEGTAMIVDVREAQEYDVEHIPGAILVPLSAFDPVNIPALDGRKLVLHCRSGSRCGPAAARLVAAGHDGLIHRLQGGLIAWKAEDGPVVAGV